MTIHRFGSPEAALAHVECDTCTEKELAMKYKEGLDELHASPGFLAGVGTGTTEAERMAKHHEQVTQGKHEIILFRCDINYPLSRAAAASIRELNVNNTLAALADSYAQFGS